MAMPLIGQFLMSTRPRFGGAFLSRSQRKAPPGGRGKFIQCSCEVHWIASSRRCGPAIGLTCRLVGGGEILKGCVPSEES